MYAPYDALASNLDLIQTIFGKRNLDLVLKRLAALYSESCTLARCTISRSGPLTSTSGSALIRHYGQESLPLRSCHFACQQDRDERLRFLEGFEIIAEDRARNIWKKTMSSMTRLMILRHRDSGGQASHYNIEQSLKMSGVYPKKP